MTSSPVMTFPSGKTRPINLLRYVTSIVYIRIQLFRVRSFHTWLAMAEQVFDLPGSVPIVNVTDRAHVASLPHPSGFLRHVDAFTESSV
jgi:hypothetical protein